MLAANVNVVRVYQEFAHFETLSVERSESKGHTLELMVVRHTICKPHILLKLFLRVEITLFQVPLKMDVQVSS